MVFSAPLWLLGLIPWAGASLYLLWGRRKRRDVPFLELWRGPAAVERARWKVSPPPLALALAILGMLVAVLGAARPGARWGAGSTGAGDTNVTLLLDRGITMSARGRGDLRFREAGRAAADAVSATFGAAADVGSWVVPAARPGVAKSAESADDTTASVAAWERSLADVRPTAIDAGDAIRELLRRRLARTRGPIMVVSDADLGALEPDDRRRVVQVAPDAPVRNAGITRLAARATPRPQVMVRVRNDSALTSAVLRVTSAGAGGTVGRRTIELPPAGNERDYFFDFPRLGDEVSADLEVHDDLGADNQEWLIRESAWPMIEIACPVGPLQRLVELYRETHPPGEGSRRVRVVARADDLAPGESGVVLAAGASGGEGEARPTRVVPHPITAAVPDWQALELPAADPGEKPPAGWAVVLSAGDRAFLAIHEAATDGGSARQVWVALSTGRWAGRPEYVAFWTAMLDWAGGSAGEVYASHPLEAFDPSWRPVKAPGGGSSLESYEPGLWPGVYERADRSGAGTLPRRAFNASPARFRPPGAVGDLTWRRKLRLLRADGPGWHDLTPAPLLAAAACALLATATWRGGRPLGRAVAPPGVS